MSKRELTLPLLRVIKLEDEALLAATLARRPNSSVVRSVVLVAEGIVPMVWRLKPGDGGAFSTLSFLEVLLRRKLRPRMDLRPLFSSGGDSVTSMLGEAGAVEVLPLELLREKKGMPEGVRRGLRRLERERPGLVVTTAGVAEVDDEGPA